MKDFRKGLSIQLTSIIISALLAGLITFLQTFLAELGQSAPIQNPVEDGAILGGIFKTTHSTFLAIRGTMKV